MSLKTFHILFVLISTTFMLLFAVWAFRNYAAQHARGDLILGVLAAASVVVLLVYGKWFLHKIKARGLA